MKISNNGNLINIPIKENLNTKKVEAVTKVKTQPATTFEKSKVEDKGHVYHKPTIDQLKKDSEKSSDTLKRMITDMLSKQGKSFDSLNSKELIKIDAATRAEATELIGPDGPLGIEAMSDTIVDFAKAISGGDKSRLDTLKNAIIKGFQEAEKALGGLPEISVNTYDRIMEKLDIWDKE